MGTGKIASQSGHAYLGAYLKSDRETQDQYHMAGLGTKVCLGVPNLDTLLRYHLTAKELGIPTVLIEDTGNNTCFNGVPTITAVGIGPINKTQARFLKKLQLME